jgi:uncharacterized protein YdeI (YjbR/CyaY-like superfamily)
MSGHPSEFFESQGDFEAWLEENHATSREIWVKLAKKASGVKSISRAEALESALCYGWIDGKASAFDDVFWLQRFTPRRPKSTWSMINCEKVTDLAAEGRMRTPGLKEVESAKQDGRWDSAYASPRNMTVPDDFQRKLEENPRAQAFFDELDSRNRYAILYRIQNAKKNETRVRRIESFITMLNERKTIY